MMTASAPAGMGAPVMISQTAPWAAAGQRGPAGAGGAGDCEGLVPGGFSGAAGKAIAGGAGKGRLIAIGGERMGKDAPHCLCQLDGFNRWRDAAQPCGMGSHQRSGLGVVWQCGARQCGAGRRGTHGMDCRGLRLRVAAQRAGRPPRRTPCA